MTDGTAERIRKLIERNRSRKLTQEQITQRNATTKCVECGERGSPRWIKGRCLACYGRLWKRENRDKVNAHQRAAKARRRDELLVMARSRYAADPEYYRAKRRRYYHANKAKERAAYIEWKARNPHWFPAYMQQYRVENIDRIKETERSWARRNPDRIRAKARKRNALKKGNGHEPYSEAAIFERDGWVCQLCLQPVDRSLRHPNLACATIDHVIPLVDGGPDTEDNVQLAHLSCNCRKGARVA